ncbi:hypothetical protein SXCC_00013 [Gluconacetobacter sp. SXCC-1]|nr:hypothetical protein SXCC_00013 [Gluconacetobacter sp. SXCC-1]
MDDMASMAPFILTCMVSGFHAPPAWPGGAGIAGAVPAAVAIDPVMNTLLLMRMGA